MTARSDSDPDADTARLFADIPAFDIVDGELLPRAPGAVSGAGIDVSRHRSQR